MISSRNQHGQVNGVHKRQGAGQEPVQCTPDEISAEDEPLVSSLTLGSCQLGEVVVWLEVWQEATGFLVGVDRVCGILFFHGFKVMVPPGELNQLVELENQTGNKIAILRTDLPHRPLLQRTINQ